MAPGGIYPSLPLPPWCWGTWRCPYMGSDYAFKIPGNFQQKLKEAFPNFSI